MTQEKEAKMPTAPKPTPLRWWHLRRRRARWRAVQALAARVPLLEAQLAALAEQATQAFRQLGQNDQVLQGNEQKDRLLLEALIAQMSTARRRELEVLYKRKQDEAVRAAAAAAEAAQQQANGAGAAHEEHPASPA